MTPSTNSSKFPQNEEIGNRIKELRNLHNLSQTQLAEEINTQQPIISKYENGETNIPYTHLFALANFFNVSCQYLLTGEQCDNYLTILKKYIHLEYCSCPADHHLQEYLELHINKAFVNYLYQAAQAEHLSRLPNKAREAWYREMEREFNTSNSNDDFVSFIPFPSKNITTDNSPNNMSQSAILEETTDFFKENFS